MLHSIRFHTVILACVLGATACSSDSISVRSSLYARNVSVHYAEAAKDGAIRTEIIGNPLNVSDATWNDHVASVFTTAHFGPRFDFSLDAVADPITQARIVVQFQPPPSTTARTICNGADTLEDSLTTPPQPTLKAVAALCVQGHALDWAIVTGPMPSSIDDTRLVQFASAIAQNIVRSNVADRNGCDNSNCN